MMHGAWETVLSTHITNCVRNDSFDPSQKVQMIEELYDLENLEMLQEEFDRYVSIDANLITLVMRIPDDMTIKTTKLKNFNPCNGH